MNRDQGRLSPLAVAAGASLATWLLAAVGFLLDTALGWALLLAGGGLVVVVMAYGLWCDRREG